MIDEKKIIEEVKSNLFDGIPTSEINKAVIMTMCAHIENDPSYSYATARFLFNDLYKSILGIDENDSNFEHVYKNGFGDYLKKAVIEGRLDKRMLSFDFTKLSKFINYKRDRLFNYLGAQTLYDRYFLRDHEQNVLETPQYFWMRIAMGLALNERAKDEYAIKFYDAISSLLFVPSTPTLFHAGTSHPQLSSCYLTTVNDSLDHIFKCISDNAQLSKWSGGLGNDWSSLRATGALIKGTGVESQGVVPFLKIANDTTVAINRSGRRRGATCAYLETWHYDIEDFLELRKNTGDERRRTHDMNTSNWVPDLFMRRVREDKDWTLFSPDETPDLHEKCGRSFEESYISYEKLAGEGKIKLTKKIKARDLWKKMISMLFETGHPWITFKDPCNIRSPQDHAGVVHSSNLCTEITLNTSKEETAVCNLGSINLSRHILGGELDKNLIKSTVSTAMRMLDNVIDINFYPTPEAGHANLKHRPVGLGIMGFQDALYKLGIDFDSEKCIKFADESMEIISYHAISTSADLSRERGAYESFKGSKWDRSMLPVDTIKILEDERGEKIPVTASSTMNWGFLREKIKNYGMRNSNCMAVAPTATIANIAGCIPTVEPIYKNIYVKSNASGEFTIVNPYLIEELKEKNLWSNEMLNNIKYHDGNISEIKEIPENIRNKYKEVFEIDQHWLIKSAAYRGKWIDQSQSINIYFSGTSGRELSNIYMYAWEMGLKTTYYLRSLGASQIEKSTVNTNEFGSTHLREAEKMSSYEPSSLPEAKIIGNVSSYSKTVNAIPKLCKIEDPDCEACQ